MGPIKEETAYWRVRGAGVAYSRVTIISREGI
jgi:hypothetical protein